MLARVGEPDLADGDVAAIQDVLVDTGALAELEQRITVLVDEAVGSPGGGADHRPGPPRPD